ncbi:MAG: hypothetical protein ACYDHX_01755 [Methanothrix sp.]
MEITVTEARLMKLVFIIITLFLINPALSKTETSPDFKPSPPLVDAVFSDELPERGAIVSSGKASSSSSGDSDYAPSRTSRDRMQSTQFSTRIEIIPSKEGLIELKKTIIPRTTNGYIFPGEFAQVRVEVYSKADENINLSLTEFMDENLAVFYPVVHGYLLQTISHICYDEQNIFNHIESGKIEAYLVNDSDNNITFFYDKINNNVSYFNKLAIPINENNINETPYSLNRSPLFEWGGVKNESLNESLNKYPYFKIFIKDKLGALNNSRIDGSIIKKYHNKISIFENNTSIINITKSDGYMDRGYVNLSYNKFVFHLRLENDTIYDNNNILTFDNVTLHPGDFFVFWYCVKSPIKSGFYEVKTFATTINNSEPKQVVFSSATVIVDNNPIFKVDRTFSNYQIFLNDELKMRFDIEYLGGGAEPKIDDVQVRFDVSDEYEYILLDDIECNESQKKHQLRTKSFYRGKCLPINVTIKFKETGIISPPSLWVNDVRKPFYEFVTVDRPAGRYFNFIYLFATAIFFVIVFVFKQLYLDIGKNKENLSMRASSLWRLIFRLSLVKKITYITIIAILFLIDLVRVSWMLNQLIPFLIRITSI